MVNRRSLKVRFLASFVTVFICLNGVGLACVAYCRTMDAPTDAADHCPLKKVSRHCGSGESVSDFAFVKSNKFDCCPMTVSFFAGPLDKHSFSVKEAAAVQVVKTEVRRSDIRSFKPLISAASYRGPPPLDRRVDRIKNRLLLI